MVLGLVPARGGSKGLPGKNIKLLAGRPLLDYTARAAVESGVLDRVVLSTDSEEIAAVGKQVGLDVPFMRPAALAEDDTPMLAVIRHALETLDEQGSRADIIVLLQPTSPLRRPRHIAAAVDLLRDSKADSVVTVAELPRHLSPDYVMRIDRGRLKPFLAEGANLTRRQDARPAYWRDGTVYACWRRTIDRFNSLYGDDCRPIVVDPADALSIDSADDWTAAERRLAQRAG